MRAAAGSPTGTMPFLPQLLNGDRLLLGAIAASDYAGPQRRLYRERRDLDDESRQILVGAVSLLGSGQANSEAEASARCCSAT